jgi:predicted nucleic-acid-binding protein
MIAIDTSIVIRIAVGDNQKQRAAGLALLDKHRVFICKTVLLETEWVLRSRYKLKPAEIADFLDFLVAAEGIVIEDTATVQKALEYYHYGADFADALHLASADGIKFYTLDKAFCRSPIKKGKAAGVEVIKVV